MGLERSLVYPCPQARGAGALKALGADAHRMLELAPGKGPYAGPELKDSARMMWTPASSSRVCPF